MITARAAGDAALLVEAGPRAGALAAAVRAARLPGVTDVVTGAVTVLLVTEPGRDLGALTQAVAALEVPEQPPSIRGAGRPGGVRRAGPGRGRAAGRADPAEVTERHAASRVRGRVAGLLPRVRVPDRPGPGHCRSAAADTADQGPGRSVAIAGPMAAVYPSASPGGWRLIGRTTVRLWDTGAGAARGVLSRAAGDVPAGQRASWPSRPRTPPSARAAEAPQGRAGAARLARGQRCGRGGAAWAAGDRAGPGPAGLRAPGGVPVRGGRPGEPRACQRAGGEPAGGGGDRADAGARGVPVSGRGGGGGGGRGGAADRDRRSRAAGAGGGASGGR